MPLTHLYTKQEARTLKCCLMASGLAWRSCFVSYLKGFFSSSSGWTCLVSGLIKGLLSVISSYISRSLFSMCQVVNWSPLKSRVSCFRPNSSRPFLSLDKTQNPQKPSHCGCTSQLTLHASTQTR